MYLNINHSILLAGRVSLTLLLIFLSACNSHPDASETSRPESSSDKDLPNDTLRVLCAKDQFQLTSQIMKEFQENHSGSLTEISLFEQRTPIEQLSLGKNDLVLVSDAQSQKIPEEYWRIQYARDGMVAIISKSNPCCEEILESGLGIKQLSQLFTGEESPCWGKVLGSGQNRPIKVFICSDIYSKGTLWANITGIMTANIQNMIDSIRKDPLSIGFCCQRYAYDPITRLEIADIKVVPLDCNTNGVLEDKEKFYDNLDLLQRAMWLGKYPYNSCLNYYIVAKEKPQSKLHIDFMKWILTEGQDDLHAAGYILLRTRFINMKIDELNELKTST